MDPFSHICFQVYLGFVYFTETENFLFKVL